ncbi:hypothetical protein [Rhodopila sp.]|uniref:hypothetical protein n=1 Tax=Rhodopila sp. TaxID=2480087 RepID=UPI003D0DA13C
MSLDKAREDLAELDRAVAQLRSKLSDVEARASKIRIYIEMAEMYGETCPTSSSDHHDLAAPPKRTRASGGIVDKARTAVIAILTERKYPTSTRDLLSELLSRGIPVGGDKPSSNLSGMLSKSLDFKSGAHGWSLASWDESQSTTDAFEEKENETA